MSYIHIHGINCGLRPVSPADQGHGHVTGLDLFDSRSAASDLNDGGRELNFYIYQAPIKALDSGGLTFNFYVYQAPIKALDSGGLTCLLPALFFAKCRLNVEFCWNVTLATGFRCSLRGACSLGLGPGRGRGG